MDKEELLGELERDLKGLREFQSSLGWELWAKSLAGVVRRLRAEILQGDASGMDGLIELAKARSELAGIEYALAHARHLQEEIAMSITEIYEEMRDVVDED